MTSILTPIQCSHLIDRPCPLVRRPGRWGVLRMRGEASAVKQRATDKPRLATIGGREGMLDCGVSRARCTLTRLNPSSHMQEHMCNGCETLCVGVCVFVCVYLIGIGILRVIHWHLRDHDPSKVGIGVWLQSKPVTTHETTAQSL